MVHPLWRSAFTTTPAFHCRLNLTERLRKRRRRREKQWGIHQKICGERCATASSTETCKARHTDWPQIVEAFHLRLFCVQFDTAGSFEVVDEAYHLRWCKNKKKKTLKDSRLQKQRV